MEEILRKNEEDPEVIREEVSVIVRECIDDVLDPILNPVQNAEDHFNLNHMDEWNALILYQIVEKLAGMRRRRKHVVHCACAQVTSGGISVANTTEWEPDDCCIIVRWRHPHLIVIVTVFVIQI